ncbi:YceI family protein [Halofilum ochraceum]|uniref:YceI family protein n=1 Tax=Halofilum ochraceum TaxID=1611323 RepID=UPI0008DA4863|nr:YceI family protein [Halofilum ochraceum]
MHDVRGFRMARAALIALSLLPLAVSAAPRTWVIDPEHFSISFGVEHAGFAEVMGLFQEAEGQFVYDPETRELESGEVTVQADSVFTAHKERDKHVRDGDFLDADAHPEIRFVATGYEPQGEDRGELRGELTLLGETRPVTLDVRINRMGEYPFGGSLFNDPPYVIGISAKTTIQRSEWGMTYGVEDDIVGDAVDLRFELEARRQEDD